MAKSKKSKLEFFLFLFFLFITILLLLLMLGNNFNFGENSSNTISIEDGKVIFPAPPVKDGYLFGGWTDQNGLYVLENSSVSDGMMVYPIFIEENKNVYQLTFVSGDVSVGTFLIEEGFSFRLPLSPIMEDYFFSGWVNEDGRMIRNGISIQKDSLFYAYWIPNSSEVVEVSFDSSGGDNIPNIILERGKRFILPVDPIRRGSTFSGWVNANNQSISSNMAVSQNMKVKAVWGGDTSCPRDCEMIDETSCSKVVYTDYQISYGCPSGYTEQDGSCLNYDERYYADFSGDEPSCRGNDYKYEEIYALGADIWCVPRVEKSNGNKVCPNGYFDNGERCYKEEIITCH